MHWSWRGWVSDMFSFRGLLLITIMTSVWFYGFTAICKQQYKDPGHPEPGPVDLDCFRLRATAGDAQTAYQLGRCYLLGTGVSQDYAEAAMWYEKARPPACPTLNLRSAFCTSMAKE